MTPSRFAIICYGNDNIMTVRCAVIIYYGQNNGVFALFQFNCWNLPCSDYCASNFPLV